MIYLIFFFLNPKIENYISKEKYMNLWIEPRQSITYTSNILEKYGFRIRTVSEWENRVSGYFPSNLLRIKKIKNFVISVKPVLRGKIYESKSFYSFSPGDYGDSYEVLNFLNLISAHKKGFIGQGILISIFDTGFELSHPAFLHIREGGRVKFTYDFNSGDSLFLIYRDEVYSVPHKRAIGYISGIDIERAKDTFFIFYSFLDERDNKKNLWKIYGTHFINGNFTGLKLLSVDTLPSLLPHALIMDNQIYLASKIINKNGEELSLTFIDKDLNIDSSKTLIAGTIINDLEILKFSGRIFIFFADTGGLKAFELNGSIKKLVNKDISGFNYEIKGDSIFIIYETFDLTPSLGIAVFDTLLNLLKDTIFDRGFSPEISIRNDTINTLFIKGMKRDTLYETKFSFSLNLINKKIIDTGFFIKSPKYLSIQGQSYIYYAKHGIIYSYKNGLIDSTFEYFVDLIETGNDVLVYRRRGDRGVEINPLTDYARFDYPGVLHGTRMLALIGGYASGEMIGTAPGADFLLFKTERIRTVEGQEVFEHRLEEDFWVEALELSQRFGAKIVSSSLGYSDWYTKEDMDGKTAISSKAASKALSKGILVVTAAGNLTSPHPDLTKPDTTIVAPGDADSVLTVGGCYLDGSIWENSAFGPSADGRIKPDIVAPYRSVSVDIYLTSTGDTLYGYGEGSGTSIATALIAGFAATCLSAHPEWDVKKLYKIIRKTANKADNPDNIYGYGVPDALEVINYEQISIPAKEGENSRIISLYPNPVKGSKIKIEYVINESITPLSFKFFTPSGKKILEISYFIKPLGRYKDVIYLKTRNGKEFPPGFYILVMETSSTKDYYKFVVEK